MRMSIIAFALGVWLCQGLPELPGTGSLVVLLAAGGAVVAAVWRAGARMRLAGMCLLALAAGFVWSAGRAQWRLADELPMAWEGRDVVVTGVIDELPRTLDRSVRFVLRVESATAPVPQRMLVSWYAPRARAAGDEDADDKGHLPSLRPGERWKLTLRLKRPHGLANPGGFDYEAWLLERGLRATGYVRAKGENVLLDPLVASPMVLVHRLRDSVRDRFLATLPGAEYAGVLVALAVGDQNAIAQEQWTVFRKTAVAHLVSISGLHVSMIALVVGGIAGWGWRRIPALTLRFPARKAAALAGLAAAAAYSLLAGLGIPTQRSLIMLSVVALALLLGRESAGSRIIALALFTVLVIDPWAVLSAGFWLSFGAVAAIMYVVGGRTGSMPGWRVAVTTQLAITLATVPVLLVLFNAFSLLSPFANAFAIPLVSFLITPLVLAAIVLPFPPLLELAHWLTGLMMVALEWLADMPFAMWQQAAPLPLLAVAGSAGVLWLLLPRGTPTRHVGALAMLPLLAWSPPRPAPGEFRLTVLDVGNGMAAHLQTARHDLMYDTGPAYGPDVDAGERVLLPYLGALGVRRLDRLVISHDDLDHTGGAASLMEGVEIVDMLADLPPGHPLRADRVAPVSCVAGERWHWDGVDFEVLHPGAGDDPRRDNDRSCVLRIAAPGGSVLLAGDIEAWAERTLLARSADALASDVVIVPHHGSRSSSSAAFITAIQAQAAIFTVGYLNPFRHPHPAVWAGWAASGARNWRTDSQGAIRVEVRDDGVSVAAQRVVAPRYWHGR
ncbi:DNA internalization-related competence protein ComEC/Rec2 [Azoarcus sp. PA01]|nr:DNA internalization-related competence protein ComEC/Rec2 [Azoarcus sp. PA01]